MSSSITNVLEQLLQLRACDDLPKSTVLLRLSAWHTATCTILVIYNVRPDTQSDYLTSFDFESEASLMR